MNTEKPNNPPAFPISTIDGYNQEGMPLRDYFAAKAMQSLVNTTNTKRITLLSRIYILIGSNKWKANYDISTDQVANTAYTIADAMLKAREEK